MKRKKNYRDGIGLPNWVHRSTFTLHYVDIAEQGAYSNKSKQGIQINKHLHD